VSARSKKQTDDPRDPLIQEVRLRLFPYQGQFLLGDGDPMGADADLEAAISCLDEVKKQLPEWAYTLLVGFAWQGVSSRKRGHGKKTTHHKRDAILLHETDRLMKEHGISQVRACTIISAGLVRLRHHMEVGTISKAVDKARRARAASLRAVSVGK
jgi:hypothetical protein